MNDFMKAEMSPVESFAEFWKYIALLKHSKNLKYKWDDLET
jgi:hypothetical protein